MVDKKDRLRGMVPGRTKTSLPSGEPVEPKPAQQVTEPVESGALPPEFYDDGNIDDLVDTGDDVGPSSQNLAHSIGGLENRLEDRIAEVERRLAKRIAAIEETRTRASSSIGGERPSRIVSARPSSGTVPASPSGSPGNASLRSERVRSTGSHFPDVVDGSRRRESRNFNPWLKGGIAVVILGVIALSLLLQFGPSVVDRFGGLQDESRHRASAASRLPSEDEGPDSGVILDDEEEDVVENKDGPRGSQSPPAVQSEVSRSRASASSSDEDGEVVKVEAEEDKESPAKASHSPSSSKRKAVTRVAEEYPATIAIESKRRCEKCVVPMEGEPTINLKFEVPEEITGGWFETVFKDGVRQGSAVKIDWDDVADEETKSLTIGPLKPGHYHFNLNTDSGWAIETAQGRFRYNYAVKVNGQEIPVGTGKAHEHMADGANFCLWLK